MLACQYSNTEVDQQDQCDCSVEEVRQECCFETTNSSVEDDCDIQVSYVQSWRLLDCDPILTSSWKKNASGDHMHSSHAGDELSSREDHAATTEDIVDQVEQDEKPMDVSSVPHPHELE